MGGKKTMEDSRKFEKDRRDKLNAAFEELCKVFPDHDPSVTLTKMEILKKAAEYIKHLQGQNDEIMKIGSDNALRNESDKLKKRITHLVLKTKELVDALRSAGVPIPNNNKRKRKKKALQGTSSNQNQIATVKQLGRQTKNDDGQQAVRKVKCGCTKSFSGKKPLKESNPTATTAPVIGNGPTISTEPTTGTSVLNSTSVIAVTSPLLSGPLMATRIQNVPISPNSATPISVNSSLPSTATASVNSDGDELLSSEVIPVNNSSISLLNPAIQSVPIVSNNNLPSNILKEVTPLPLISNAIVTTATSSNVLTTQTIVNSTQLISIPENSIINSPVVASRLQSVPVIEKNIISNLGPGTLILADGRIVNVPPIVPQIVVKQQPAVIVMPTTKRKEKLIIPKRRDVTETTFANKAPIPAIQTFRLQSCPRIRPKKKPKPNVKKSEKTKATDSKEIDEDKKKRKIEAEPQQILETKKDEQLSRESSNNNEINNELPEKLGGKDCKASDNTFVTENNLNCLDNSNMSLAISLNENNSASSFCNLTVSVSEMETNSLNSTSLSPRNNDLVNTEYISNSTSNGSVQMTSENLSQSATEKNDSIDDLKHSQTNCLTVEEETHMYTNTGLEVISDSIASASNASDSNDVPPISPGSISINTASAVNDNDGIDTSNPIGEVSSEKSTDNNVLILTDPSSGNTENNDLNVSLLVKENSNPTNGSSSELLTNIPPCISSSTIQDSIFAPIDENHQNILNDSNISSFSLDSVQKESTSGIEMSTNESVETDVYEMADQGNADISQENQNQPLSPTENFKNISTTLDEAAIRNGKVDETGNTSTPSKESESMTSSNNECHNSSNEKSMTHYKQNTSNETVRREMPTVYLSKPQASDKHCPVSVTTQDKSVYTQASSFCQSIGSITNSTHNCPVTISTTQNSYPVESEKNYSENCNIIVPEMNTPKSSAFPNQPGNGMAVHNQNNLKAVCTTSSQLPYSSHSAYGVSNIHCERDPMLFSSTTNKSGFSSNKKNTNNNALSLFSTNSSASNSHLDYCSTTVCTNATISYSQTFPLKPAKSSANVISSNLSKNSSDIYSSFNKTLATDANKHFYSQNSSLPSSQWEKSHCNKSIYSSFSGHTTSEQILKEKSSYQKNKNSSLDKQGPHSQLSYLSFQNEHIIGPHSNTFFHNLSNCSTVLPGNSGFSETPAVVTSSSIISSNSLSSHENPSIYSRSTLGDKAIQQERLFHSNTTTTEHVSFRSNEKLNTGTALFYPNSVHSNVYPGSTQPNISSTYNSFTQTNGLNIYTTSQHNVASAYDNSVQHNLGNVYTTSSHINIPNVYTSLSQASMASSSQPNILSIYSNPVQTSATNAYANVPQPAVTSIYTSTQLNASGVYTSSLQSNVSNIYAITTQHNVSNIYPSSFQSNTTVYTCQTQPAASNSYASIATPKMPGVYTSIAPPSMSNIYTNSTQHTYATSQTNLSNDVSRYPICGENINEPSLFRGNSISKFKKTSESSNCIPVSNYKPESANTITNTKANDCNKLMPITNKNDLNSSAFNESRRNNNKDNNTQSSCQTSGDKNNLNEEQRCTQQLQSGYLQEKDILKSGYPTSSTNDMRSSIPSSEHRPSGSEYVDVNNHVEKDVSKNINKTNLSKTIENDSNGSSDLNKYNSYGFIPNKNQNVQSNNPEATSSSNKTVEGVDKSIQSNFKSFVVGTDEKSSDKHISTSQKAIDNVVNSNDINYGVNTLPTTYRKLLIPQNNSFPSNRPKITDSSLQARTYSNFNSTTYESISNQYTNDTLPYKNTINTNMCTTQSDQQSQSVTTGSNSGTSEHKNKSSVESVSEKQDKAIQKTCASTNVGNTLKTDISTDFLKSKDMERNTFIPIIDDVRQISDFSTDLFSSLQVPPGGQHSESISPTAAFLLAFPLVSTSRNVESLHDNENQDNQTSTPTTILQIGNIDPPSTELFHPIDFQKNNSKSSDHFDVNSDYLHVNDLQDKQATGYKRCEKRKDTFSEFSKDLRPTDAKQKPRIITTTANTYSHAYSQPLLSCTDYQYCEKNATQWPQEYSSNNPKEQKKNCDRKKDKINQKGYFQQNYQEYYNYKEKKRKQQNRISVNWMSTPENREQQTEYQAKDHEPGNNLMGPPTQALYSTIPLDFPTESFPDFCNSKKSNNYSWSPSKSLLPTLDNNLMIPSTLPTLVGDLALGTSTPSESYKTFETPKSQNQNQQAPMAKKTPEKIDENNKKRNDFPKGQANFFSVSQLVDPKSKKSKTNDRNYKRQDKNSKSRNNFNCTKRKDDHCMYYEDRSTFISNANQCSEKRLAYKGGSYSAESLISGVQHNDVEYAPGFNYQQNTNYFQSEFPHNIESTNQQYGYLQQTHFTGFNHEECQEFSFNTNQRGLDSNRQKSLNRKEESFQGTSLIQPHIYPPYTKSINYNLPAAHLNTNTTTTLTNFNLSTIFPEMNDQRVGTSGQPPPQMNSSFTSSQNYRNHLPQ